jgi:hypothetical protein
LANFVDEACPAHAGEPPSCRLVILASEVV